MKKYKIFICIAISAIFLFVVHYLLLTYNDTYLRFANTKLTKISESLKLACAKKYETPYECLVEGEEIVGWEDGFYIGINSLDNSFLVVPYLDGWKRVGPRTFTYVFSYSASLFTFDDTTAYFNISNINVRTYLWITCKEAQKAAMLALGDRLTGAETIWLEHDDGDVEILFRLP